MSDCPDVQDDEGARLQEIRDALGAVAIGEPAVYRLKADGRGLWHLSLEGRADGRSFEVRADALAAARLAVVRCRSYCLIVEGQDGRVSMQLFNWPEDRCAAGAAGPIPPRLPL